MKRKIKSHIKQLSVAFEKITSHRYFFLLSKTQIAFKLTGSLFLLQSDGFSDCTSIFFRFPQISIPAFHLFSRNYIRSSAYSGDQVSGRVCLGWKKYFLVYFFTTIFSKIAMECVYACRGCQYTLWYVLWHYITRAALESV